MTRSTTRHTRRLLGRIGARPDLRRAGRRTIREAWPSPSPPSDRAPACAAWSAAADQLAASAGIAMLAQGGSAADAAVATGTVMAVVGPHLCGLGGDVLAMVSVPGSPPEALLSIGRAGAGSDPSRMRAEGMSDHAVAGRHPQRAGARRGRRLARPARALRAAAPRRRAGPGDRAGRGGLRRLHHAGAGQPSRPRPPRCRRALPGGAARHRADRARPGHRPHAARHRPARPRRLLPG